MKILGISGSQNKGNTYYIIKTVLEATGQDYEIIFLLDKN
ncbi:NAD(P)H-dependent oxidoreductase [Candidatus Micrarchaeota archaeon]|jgi:multimeric flavodoxin WrbA|nr:NAD(P)H-dependent oxidoreductase [Candidatus Micrarchaeota archaeon]